MPNFILNEYRITGSHEYYSVYKQEQYQGILHKQQGCQNARWLFSDCVNHTVKHFGTFKAAKEFLKGNKEWWKY